MKNISGFKSFISKLEAMHTSATVSESVEITTDVAIEFSEWMDANLQKREYIPPMSEMTTKELFEEFINNHY